MEYSGAGGKLIHEKNQKQKISWHCPFKCGKSFAGLFWLLRLDFIVNHLEKIRARNEGSLSFRVLKEVGWLMDY